MDIQNLTSLLDIADKAIKLQDAESTRKDRQKDLSNAFNRWKVRNGHSFVEKNSPEWSEMMDAADAEYDVVQRAKAAERRARRRLAVAVDRYREVA